MVHTAGDPLSYAKAIRSQVYELDGSQFLDKTYTLEGLMDLNVYSRGRFNLWLMGAFAALGLTLAAIGLFGLLSHIVELRRQEYCVRMALGATSGDILALVLGGGARLLLAGFAAGIVSTLLLLRGYGIELGVSDPYDIPSLAGACLLLAAVGLVACLMPAWRASATTPAGAMRSE